jgi:hypothetical protein
LTVTLSPGQSGGLSAGAGILFTTSGGTLSSGATIGTSVIAQADYSGVASIVLTLPATKGNVTLTAQDMFAADRTSVTIRLLSVTSAFGRNQTPLARVVVIDVRPGMVGAYCDTI